MQTKAQARATRENFCIFMLTGWRRFIKSTMRGVLSKYALRELTDSIDYAISDIKATQKARRG